jgi:hypothetical protein
MMVLEFSQVGLRDWHSLNLLVFKDDTTVTIIPYSVKENDTCRAIIKALNSQC